jgi:hypothetical protein
VRCEEVIKTVFSAEEEAFLRSLGWEDCGDDSEGGLTEEEIAAFQAQAAAAARLPARHRSTPVKGAYQGAPVALKSTPTNIIPLKANGSSSFPASFPVSCPSANGRGYQSELEFSDSDEDSVRGL